MNNEISPNINTLRDSLIVKQPHRPEFYSVLKAWKLPDRYPIVLMAQYFYRSHRIDYGF